MNTQPAKHTKKNKGLKIILTIVLLIIALLAVLPLFLNSIVDTLIKQQVAAIFGDKLKIGSMQLSFLTGTNVTVNQIELQQPPGYRQGNLVKAESILVRVALIPLLKKQLLIREVAVIRPDIHLIQSQNGQLNLGYYLAKFGEKPADTTHPGLVVRLNQFTVKNGKIILSSYSLSDRQPTFILTDCHLKLKDLVLPNLNKNLTKFRFTSLLGTTRPAKVEINGTGVFGANTISFIVNSKIDNLPLSDYSHLVPKSSFTINSGQAWVISNARCNNNYLNSQQHVKVKNLKLTAKKGHVVDGTLLGVPANIFTKFIEDEKGAFDFDFSVSGQFNDLKANLKFRVAEAISKSISAKLGLGRLSNKAVKSVKKVSNKVVNTFKGIFKGKN